MTRTWTIPLVALPGLLLAAFGWFVHPGFLDASTARAWWTLHVYLIPVFPLILLAVVLLLRGVGGPVAWAARITAYGFATFYTALDVLSGIGAGLAVEAGAGDLVGRLFEIGDALGRAGVWMLLASALLTNLWGRSQVLGSGDLGRVGSTRRPAAVGSIFFVGCALLVGWCRAPVSGPT